MTLTINLGPFDYFSKFTLMLSVFLLLWGSFIIKEGRGVKFEHAPWGYATICQQNNTTKVFVEQPRLHRSVNNIFLESHITFSGKQLFV